ncbi:hypothetical protein GCM10009738_87020 [Kitasatospora viridis]|uniref:Uncharacterized protein DUF4328 n=1 Tax=Kitasatospora viridis TaxID=281105 RepID=A0A561S9Q4_9ACTN|nr:uncharacterized protein DUF4328 [Kitasatospora viridis]
MVADAIVRSVWIRWCWTSAEALAPGSRRSGRGWVAGVWFVPLVRLWLPRRVVLDLRRAGGLPDGRFVNAWWGVGMAVCVGAAVSGFRGLHRVAALVECVLALVRMVAFVRMVEALALPLIPGLGERASQSA